MATGAITSYSYNAFGFLARRDKQGVSDRHYLWSGHAALSAPYDNATIRVLRVRAVASPVIPWLLVVFRPELTLAWLPGDIGPGFTLADELFEQVRDDDLSAFYDRLYSRKGMMVGVQITPIIMPDLAKELQSVPYVCSARDGQQVRIMFDGTGLKAELREEIDQAFGGRIYRSLGNEIAISFDTYFLEEAERTQVADRNVKWVTVTPLEG